MITGQVNAELDALIPLQLLDDSGTSHPQLAAIDTGFNGHLTLPSSLVNRLGAQQIGWGRAILADGVEKMLPLYEVAIIWDGEFRTIDVDEAETAPLVGMALMEGYELRLEVQSQGALTLQRLP